MSPKSASEPYLFEYEYVAMRADEELPDVYPKLGMPYALSLIDEYELIDYGIYFKEEGSYKLIVNLKDFTLTVTQE